MARWNEGWSSGWGTRTVSLTAGLPGHRNHALEAADVGAIPAAKAAATASAKARTFFTLPPLTGVARTPCCRSHSWCPQAPVLSPAAIDARKAAGAGHRTNGGLFLRRGRDL